MHSNFPIMLPLQLICIFSFILLLLPPSISTGLVAKSGCPVRCGNLSIPFPFGVGPDCSLEPSFNINCDTSTGSPKAYITIIDKEVIEINETYVRVRYPNYLASSCYNLSDIEPYGMAVNLSGTVYTLSGENWLTAIGCDDMVVGTEKPVEINVGSSCASICSERNDTGSIGYCPDNGLWSVIGNGCCRAPISGGSTFLSAQLTDLSGALLRPRLFPCSYSFIQEKGTTNASGFSYHLDFLQQNSKAFPKDEYNTATTTAPVVQLSWQIGNKNCSEQLPNDPSYACRDGNVCVDSYPASGYLCSCFQGYKGNPYLEGGCQAFSSSVAKPGCQHQCGNLSIPFPFGIGSDCYKEPSFEIICNASSNPPKAYLSVLEIEIIELNQSQIRVNYPKMALACYNSPHNRRQMRKTEGRSLVIDLTATGFTLSDQNVITAMGCDDMVVAYGKSSRGFVGGSCAAFCTSLEDSRNFGFCAQSFSGEDIAIRYMPGFGCCQTVISKGTAYLEANLTDLSVQWRRKKLFPCSYAFVAEKSPYSVGYPLDYLSNSTTPLLEEFLFMLALVLDWRIGTENCNEAQKNPSTFACRENSVCTNFEAKSVGGYLCNCSKGYEGNPYLTQGCKDIDECANKATNPCQSNSLCINIPGSYRCACPRGYIGDGSKGGVGCIKQAQSKTKMMILTSMGSGLGFLALLLACIRLYSMLKRRKEKMVKEKFFKRNGGLLLQQQSNEGALGKTKVFSANVLEVATDNFNESRILGQGGQGTVYKGMLSDGKIVAIKKSKLVEENQLEQFINEVAILSQINHRNVVKLLGCCLETEVPLLVYEFMPNGTLFELIHDPNNEFPFPWNMRLKMAADIAGALSYLHYASSMPIYHRDIKSSNILLDEKYIVKVSDFGTSRSIDIDQTHLTTMVKGTFGYLDPEYYQTSQYTEKSDVYSFGVVLVELLTGQRPISFDRKDEERGLATRFLKCMEDNCLETILDPQVLEQGGSEEVILVARLAERCLNMKGKMRPTMKEVANELENTRMSLMSNMPKDEYEDVRALEDIPLTISDIEYTWTVNYNKSATSSSAASDKHPLMLETK